MTTITAEVVLDSVSENNVRLTTMKLRYPRIIHAELMTHRVFSRNASSSRAIPVSRLIQETEADPYVPASWGSNVPGMQAGTEMPVEAVRVAKAIYMNSFRDAIYHAKMLSKVDPQPHKQIINRILEPYSHISVLVTSTQWANWDYLRYDAEAEPNIMELAKRMIEARAASIPTELPHDGWHLPFINLDEDIPNAAIHLLEEFPRLGEDEENLMSEILYLLAKVSAGRCARVSYNNHDGTAPRLVADLEVFNKLMKRGGPVHASPCEHQAQPDRLIGPTWEKEDLHGNFVGWCQYRKYFLAESVADKPYTGPRLKP